MHRSAFLRHGGTLGTTCMLLTAMAWHGQAHAAALSVCIDKSSPQAVVDHRLAEAVAREQHATLVVHEFDGSGDDDGGFDPDDFRHLASSTCSLVLGFPVDAQAGELPQGLKATIPYGQTGFVLVTSSNSHVASLTALPQGSAVAVTYQTMPNLYFANHPALHADVHPTDVGSITALEQHQVQAAILWRPSVAHYLNAHTGTKVNYHVLDEPHARWNLVALYMDAHATDAASFGTSVEALRRSGKLASLLSPYAVVTDSSKATTWTSVRPRHASLALDRSRKPRGQRCDSTTPPALYTPQQAEQGKQKFEDNCSLCHGDHLEGRAGPALKGKLFASPTAGFHVSDIFTIVSQNMPATQPASLPPDDYVQIMAYILQQNGYPAGNQELTFDEAKSSKVQLIYHGL